MELPDLTGGRPAAQIEPAPLPQFVPDAMPAATAPPPLFEISPTAGVPDELLAPARAAAEAAGYAAGWAHGIRAARLVSDAEAHAATVARERAEAQRAAELARSLAALDGAATALEQRVMPTAHELEGLIVNAAFDIAEALVGNSLRDDATRGSAALARALSLAPTGEDVTVALSPADYEAVGGDSVNAASDGAFTRALSLVADPGLAPGDAIAQCGATRIDARISTGLERVRALLAQPSAPGPVNAAAARTPATPDILATR